MRLYTAYSILIMSNFSGMSLGTVIALPFSGILAEKMGWEAVFYVQGGLGSIWCVLWLFFVFDSPKDHPRIHPAERSLFENCMENGGAKRPVCYTPKIDVGFANIIAFYFL